MAMSICFHTKGYVEFNAEAYVTSNVYSGVYPVIKIEGRVVDGVGKNEVTFFPTFEQAKIMHKALTVLMKEMREKDLK